MEKLPIVITYIIDDDQFYQSGIKRLLDFIPVEKNVLQFYDGQHAIDYLKSGNLTEFPTLIFLDINMPLMNGWEFLDEFIKLNKKPEQKTTIYMVTSSLNDDDLAKASKYKEITEYVIKPIALNQLKELFNKVA